MNIRLIIREEIDLLFNESNKNISTGLKYHIDNNIPLNECVYRYGSDAQISLYNEARKLVLKNNISLKQEDEDIIKELEIKKVVIKNIGEVYLDLIYEQEINEAQYKGKNIELNKPKRGGEKKFFVYVKNPKTGKIKKVSFGAKEGGGNLSVKINDPKARKSFSERHKCSEKKDKTKPGYWSCRLPYYAKILGLSGGGKYFW